jgi:hypothetical protein
MLGLLAPSSVNSAPLEVSLTAGPTAVPGGFSYTYSINTLPTEQVSTGDFFTVYDFAGLFGIPTAPAGWSVATPLLGVTPSNVSPFTGDNPALPNLVFTRTGAALPGPLVNFGPFTATSVFGGTVRGSFTAQTTDTTETPAQLLQTTGRVAVPTPEPSTMLLALAGPVFLFGAVRRGLRRRQE